MSTQSEYNTLEKYLFKAGIFTLILTVVISIGGVVFADSLSPDNSNYGWFKVESLPATGEVIFDGQSYGSSPALIKVNTDAPPSHEIIVKMDGYEDYSQQISYNPGKGETVSINLDATKTLDNIIAFLKEN